MNKQISPIIAFSIIIIIAGIAGAAIFLFIQEVEDDPVVDMKTKQTVERKLCYNDKYSTEFYEFEELGETVIALDSESLEKLKQSIGEKKKILPEELEGLHCLEYLNLGYLDLKIDWANYENIDLSSLVSFKKLRILILEGIEGQHLSDISFLSELENLEYLDLYNVYLYPFDVSFLSSLTNLKVLNLNSTGISEMPHLDKLINLEKLFLNTTRWRQSFPVQVTDFSDVSFLSNLANLKVLHLPGIRTDILDLFPVSELSNLEEFLLNYCLNECNLNFLSELRNLEKLDLAYNELEDISFLSPLTNLKILDLRGNYISNLSPLLEMPNLKELYLGLTNFPGTDYTRKGLFFADISPLSELNNLKVLRIETAPNLSDICAIAELESLEFIAFSEIGTSDFSCLSERYKQTGDRYRIFFELK